MQAWVLGYEEKGICRLKRCLRDFNTKDHLCLFLDLLSIECLSKIIYCAPQCWAWAFSFSFCFLHLVLSIIILVIFVRNSIFFGPFGFFLHTPNFVWTFFMIENFFYAPLVLLGHFQSLRFFFMSLALASSMRCDPSQCYFQKCYQA